MELEKSEIFYVIGLIISVSFMFWIFFYSFLILDLTFLIFFWLIYFLSGFGLILNISILFLFICEKLKHKIRKIGVNCFIIIQIIIIFLVNIYAIYRIYSSFVGEGGLLMYGIWDNRFAWIDNIIYIFSIISLLIFLYINPIIKNNFKDAIVQGRAITWKFGAKQIGREIKKKYYTLRSKYAKLQLQNQLSGNELLKLWQNKFAVFFLILLAIAAFIITPIAFICVVFWLKIFIFDKSEIKNYEKIALLISTIIIGIVACVGPLYT
ncbi:MAG: hypothetical protein ACFFDK_14720, partial [Promethearchaeota archaeon]